MRRQIAVIEVKGRRVLVPARKHNYHRDTEAAVRALGRAAARFPFDTRGVVYPANADGNDPRNWTICIAL